MTTVPIHVYKCWDCGRLYATTSASSEIPCAGSYDDPHEQTFMECVLESSIDVTTTGEGAV